MTDQDTPRFSDLGLPQGLLDTVTAIGYETPSPIQAQTIPVLLQGQDLIGQAQTGTGKTAAFALPLLAKLDTSKRHTQALVLAPTRELAIQVAEACQTYARNMPGFHVVPIYGGAAYGTQLKQLRGGAQLVVGTPGRVMDHMRRGSLKLDELNTLVLDEADEMLRMGFIDDVKWVLEQTPAERQVALFSATMPKEIQAVANAHLRNPQTIKIKNKTTTAAAINQRYWPVAGLHKLDALTRILEAEPVEGAVVFVRTKIATTELAEKLSARGFMAEALNGDMAQAQREKTLDRMRQGKLDILIATDVAARGIDIPRISHVINYDIPFDTEAYVHRIGRTGRAGRTGEAILFVANRERRMLKAIERATKQPIAVMNLPSEKDINAYRVARFKKQIEETLSTANLDLYRKLIEELQDDTGTPAIEIAAALAHLKQGDTALLLQERQRKERPARDFETAGDFDRDKPKKRQRDKVPSSSEALPLKDHPDVEMMRYCIEVGYQHGVKPGNIVGAIANELDLDSAYIGHIEIFDEVTTVDLPEGMPRDLFEHLKKVRVCQRPLNIRALGGNMPPKKKRDDKPDKGKSKSKLKVATGGTGTLRAKKNKRKES
jgi:ATP-dependent RNA helicase DeaD